MQDLNEIKEVPKGEMSNCKDDAHGWVRGFDAHGCCGHRVTSYIAARSGDSSYPRISPAESDLLDQMGDALGG